MDTSNRSKNTMELSGNNHEVRLYVNKEAFPKEMEIKRECNSSNTLSPSLGDIGVLKPIKYEGDDFQDDLILVTKCEDNMDVKVEEWPIKLDIKKEDDQANNLSPSQDLFQTSKHDYYNVQDSLITGNKNEGKNDVKVEEIPIELDIKKEDNIQSDTRKSLRNIFHCQKLNCGYISENACDFKNHKHIKLDSNVNKRNIFHCHKISCTFKSENECDFKDHMLKIHRNGNEKQCTKCGLYFSERCNFIKHQTTCIGEKQHQCDNCDFASFDAITLLNHEKTHTEKKPYQCNHCGNLLTYKTNLYKHLKSKCKANPYRCSQCDYGFTGREKLVEHIAKHIQENTHNSIQWNKS